MKTEKLSFRIIVFLLVLCLAFGISPVAWAQTTLVNSGSSTISNTAYNLPAPDKIIVAAKNHSQPVLKGIKVDLDNPFHWEFLIDTQDKHAVGKQELGRLISYFLAALTIPEKDLWVNLSPYEAQRIVPSELSITDLGKDLLAEDYILKQLVSSSTYPESELGSKYWHGIYENLSKNVGNAKVAVNTFHKVWVVPQKAKVYENGNIAVIVEARLKALCEEDYLAMSKNSGNIDSIQGARGNTITEVANKAASQAFKETILPEINRYVNENGHFAQLRQIYNCVILAAWFKKTLKESIYKYYIDRDKIKGIDIKDKDAKEKIYNLYVEAFKKGAYNYIKRDYDQHSRKIIKRQYFSGGMGLQFGAQFGNPAAEFTSDPAALDKAKSKGALQSSDVDVRPVESVESVSTTTSGQDDAPQLSSTANPIEGLFLSDSQGTARAPELRAQLEKVAARKKQFRDAINNATALSEAQREAIAQKVQAGGSEAKLAKAQKQSNLWQFVRSLDLAVLTAEEAAIILYSFKDIGDFEGVIHIYENCPNRNFKESSVMREFYAVALNKTNRMDRSIEVCEQMIADGYANGEIYGALGKAYKVKGDIQKSYEYYLKGYLLDFEYYPGVNAVYNLIKMGKHEEAERLAKMVYYSTLQAGGLQSTDYWCLVTMLETACIRRLDETEGGKDRIDAMLGKVLIAAKNDWEIQTTLDNLKDLAQSRKQNGEDTTVLENVVAKLQKKMDAIHGLSQDSTPPLAEESDKRNDLTKAVLSKTFHYRGLTSNFVAGNYRYRGQLHDHVVNRADIAAVKTLLDRHGLNRIDDINEFNRIMDEVLRRQFGTAEDIDSPAHDDLDDFTLGFKKVSGTAISGDSRTNVVADFLLGKGDCRHHAYMKQLCFDLWKATRLNDLMRKAYTALQGNDIAEYDRCMQAVKDLEHTQMYTLDAEVWPQIKVNSEGKAVRDEQGRYIRSDKCNPYEEHTLNVVVHVDEDGNIQNVRLADAFYQNVYAFRDHDARPTINAEGVLEFDGGTILANDGSGNMVPVQVKLRPTSYAGKRDQKNDDDYGQLRNRGVEVKTPRDIAPLMRRAAGESPGRQNVEHFVTEMINYQRAAAGSQNSGGNPADNSALGGVALTDFDVEATSSGLKVIFNIDPALETKTRASNGYVFKIRNIKDEPSLSSFLGIEK